MERPVASLTRDGSRNRFSRVGHRAVLLHSHWSRRRLAGNRFCIHQAGPGRRILRCTGVPVKNPKKTLCFPLLLALAFTGGAPPAAIGHDEKSHENSGGFVPVPAEYYDPIDISACGTTVTLTSGDVREVEMKEKVKWDGTTVVKYRGDATIDLLRASDGAFIDELDISGAGSDRLSSDQRNLRILLKGPSIVWALSALEAESLRDAGLPEFLYYKRGKLILEADFPESIVENPEVAPTSVEIVKNTIRHAKDVCKMLDYAAEKEAH